jgi:hypothetical protein
MTVNFNPAGWSGIEIHATAAGNGGTILAVSSNAGAQWYWQWDAAQTLINVAGPWNYTGTISVPTPTVGTHAANANYVASQTAAKVSKAGDTVTGMLSFTYAAPIQLNPAATADVDIYRMTNSSPRWLMRFGGAGETGSGNAGCDFILFRFSDTGALIDAPFTINRATGNVALSGALTAAGNIQGSGAIFTNSGNIYTAVGQISSLEGNLLTQKSSNTASHTINSAGVIDDARTIYQKDGVNKWQIISSAEKYNIYNGAISSGVALASQSATSWSALSDERLKENVEPLAVLDMLAGFRAVRYTMKTTGEVELGIIAQEQVETWPELINRGSDGELVLHENKEDGDDSGTLKTMSETWSAKYDRFGVIALQGVKELLERLEALETEVAALRAR